MRVWTSRLETDVAFRLFRDKQCRLRPAAVVRALLGEAEPYRWRPSARASRAWRSSGVSRPRRTSLESYIEFFRLYAVEVFVSYAETAP